MHQVINYDKSMNSTLEILAKPTSTADCNTNGTLAAQVASVLFGILFAISEALAITPTPKASGIIQGIVSFIKTRLEQSKTDSGTLANTTTADGAGVAETAAGQTKEVPEIRVIEAEP